MSDKKKKNGQHQEPSVETAEAPQADVLTGADQQAVVDASSAPTEPPPEAPAEAAPGPSLESLKAAVVNAHANERAAAESLADAKARSADAEHALCAHVIGARSGNARGLEIEIDGSAFKPKLSKESSRYRLDKAPQFQRVTI